jgi:hypothetical protein
MAFDEVDPQTNGDGDTGYDAYSDYPDTGDQGDDGGGQDRDYDTVQYGDDRSDVPDAFSFDEVDRSLDHAVKVAETVLDLAPAALKVLESAVQSNPQAAAALKTLRVTAQIAGGFTEYAAKKAKRTSDDFDRVPVSVPTGGTTGGRRRTTTDAVREALARIDD